MNLPVALASALCMTDDRDCLCDIVLAPQVGYVTGFCFGPLVTCVVRAWRALVRWSGPGLSGAWLSVCGIGAFFAGSEVWNVHASSGCDCWGCPPRSGRFAACAGECGYRGVCGVCYRRGIVLEGALSSGGCGPARYSDATLVHRRGDFCACDSDGGFWWMFHGSGGSCVSGASARGGTTACAAQRAGAHSAGVHGSGVL